MLTDFDRVIVALPGDLNHEFSHHEISHSHQLTANIRGGAIRAEID
jgi:hypothetical protein